MKIITVFLLVLLASGICYSQQVAYQSNFESKKYKVEGSYQIVKIETGYALRLSEDFDTKSGPDLKIFLSPLSKNQLTGRNATEGAIQIALLKSTDGEQQFDIPAHVDLTTFRSVAIHCEKYSVLWGVAPLVQQD